MTRSILLFSLALCATMACAQSAEARRGARHVSDNGEYSFQVEIDGYAAPIYSGDGRSWIEGVYGRSYAIRVFNHTGERIEAVVSVDGRDVVSGGSGDYRKQRGYVIDPYGSVLIDGFRQSYQNVAAFYFTAPGDAYASRMGDSRNLGVIGVAVFRERTPYVPPPPPIAYETRRRSDGLGSGRAAKSAPAPSSGAARSYESEAAADAPRSQSLGTGYGESTYSPVSTTKFVRRSARRPDVLLSIRYDDRQGLIDNGVLARPYYPPQPPQPQPFPSAQPQFAPPPPPQNPPPWYWE
ncbi:MAG: hypothetical protein MUC50_17990 [Myxococcota bacterium]|jgi:hypothetical protein|nr:hypothetical protein [Myxococcota bacterium]